ncbi:MAG: amidase [Opitutae bacterium]|nr:amidase [Opitutae bacterium]
MTRMNTDKNFVAWLGSDPRLSVQSVVKKIVRLLFMGFASLTVVHAADFAFAEATIDSLQARMAAGTLTAHELTAAYLARIAEIDRAGPKLNAVIELNPDALAIADALDAERKAGHVRGPLHGIPILIKDNIATADRMETTAGSLALVGAKPPQDAALVTRLRAAGAVILGKTNLSEWAGFRSRAGITGWSGRGGQTRNPYVLYRNPWGSSAGSAVAVAANLCVAAVGTETDGSIMGPAGHAAIVAVKPTVGLVSRTGVIPLSASQDTPGPMARTVRDAAILLAVLAGPDARDAATQALPPGELPALAAALPAGALRGARIGVLRNSSSLRPTTAPVLEAALAVLRAAGAELVDPLLAPTINDLDAPEAVVWQYEFKAGLNAYLATLGPGAPVKSLADVIAFNEAHRAQEMPLFGQDTLVQAQARGPLTEPAYLDALAACRRLARTEGLDALLAKHRLDAIVAVTNGPAGFLDVVNGNTWTGGSAGLAAVAGYPNVTVPAAQVAGLPVGISFFGAPWTEARLLGFAADFEARTQARRPPTYRTAAELLK